MIFQSNLFRQGEWVWVKPVTKDIYELPFAGKVLRTDKEKSLVLNDDDKEVWVANSQVSNKRSGNRPIDNVFCSRSLSRCIHRRRLWTT